MTAPPSTETPRHTATADRPQGDHALLPWRISHTDGSNYALEIVATDKRGNEELVCRPPGKKRDANAAFIVTAVNSHASLTAKVAELERMLDAAAGLIADARSGHIAGSDYDERWDADKREFTTARAALDNADGGREYDPNVAPCDDEALSVPSTSRASPSKPYDTAFHENQIDQYEESVVTSTTSGGAAK